MEDCKHAGPADQAAAAELGRIVAKRVASLPPRQREVLVLSVYEGLPVVEIKVYRVSDLIVPAPNYAFAGVYLPGNAVADSCAGKTQQTRRSWK